MFTICSKGKHSLFTVDFYIIGMITKTLSIVNKIFFIILGQGPLVTCPPPFYRKNSAAFSGTIGEKPLFDSVTVLQFKDLYRWG